MGQGAIAQSQMLCQGSWAEFSLQSHMSGSGDWPCWHTAAPGHKQRLSHAWNSRMFVALAGSMALRCHHNNLLPAAHGAGGHSARLQLWARGQDVLGLSCLPPCTQGRAAAHQFSLLMWSPKPGVSMTVSFMRTPFSSISEREESWCVR